MAFVNEALRTEWGKIGIASVMDTFTNEEEILSAAEGVFPDIVASAEEGQTAINGSQTPGEPDTISAQGAQ